MPETDDLTRRALAMVANVTGGLSPQAFAGAWFTVLGRLATSPGRQAELARQVLTKTVAMAQFAGGALGGRAPDAEGTPYSTRFSGPEWSRFPFNLLAQSFLTVSGVARAAVRAAGDGAAEAAGAGDRPEPFAVAAVEERDLGAVRGAHDVEEIMCLVGGERDRRAGPERRVDKKPDLRRGFCHMSLHDTPD